MKSVALFVRLHARANKADELETLLRGAIALANAEVETLSWYALKFDSTTFGIFDTFADESGRRKHLAGPIAAALMANADRLLQQSPHIEEVQLLASK